MGGLTILTHTHTDCADLWEPYFDSYTEFFNQGKHVVLINSIVDELKYKQVVYKEEMSYVDRLILALNEIDTEFVLISFEDMILYDKVDSDKIDRLIWLMSDYPEIFFIRLLKSGVYSEKPFNDEGLYYLMNSDFLFSITPTIWNRKSLIKFLTIYSGLSVWDLESVATNSLKHGFDGYMLYHYNNEPKRGLNHHDSGIYPHICSAILKGKWNLSEYSNELKPIIEKYNIDVKLRGYV